MSIIDFGRNSHITWTAEDLRKEREAERDEQEESVFSDNPDWYLRMEADQRKGWADYE